MKDKEQFYALVEKVIATEADQTNNDIFSLEGEDIVNNLFYNGRLIDQGVYQSMDMGFSPVALEVGKTSVEFLSIIVSLFNIYIQFKTHNKELKKVELDKIKLQSELIRELEKNKSTKELAIKISEKYHTDILKLIKSK